ncbi:MAG: ATP-binding cassette domain-containing protein [Lachnospiraceae bacterium]
MDKSNNVEYAVEMNHVSKIYKLKKKDGKEKSKGPDHFYALKDISLKIEKGDVVGILGTNGSGKSTVSVVLAGISDIDEGDLTINGEQALISTIQA